MTAGYMRVRIRLIGDQPVVEIRRPPSRRWEALRRLDGKPVTPEKAEEVYRFIRRNGVIPPLWRRKKGTRQ